MYIPLWSRCCPESDVAVAAPQPTPSMQSGIMLGLTVTSVGVTRNNACTGHTAEGRLDCATAVSTAAGSWRQLYIDGCPQQTTSAIAIVGWTASSLARVGRQPVGRWPRGANLVDFDHLGPARCRTLHTARDTPAPTDPSNTTCQTAGQWTHAGRNQQGRTARCFSHSKYGCSFSF